MSPTSRLRAAIAADPAAPLDERLYHWLTLVGAVATFGFIIPVNALNGILPWVDVGCAIFGALSGALFWLSRKGRRYPLVFCALVVVLIDAMWFLDAGADGAVPYWFPVVTTLLTLFLRGKTRWIVVVAFLVNASVLLYVDFRWPDLAPRLPTRASRFVDLISGFPIAGATCALVFALTLEGYRRERQRIADVNGALERTLAEVRTLEGLLPICGWCKKIRDDEGSWVQVERYVAERTDAAFSHGICPECEGRAFPE